MKCAAQKWEAIEGERLRNKRKIRKEYEYVKRESEKAGKLSEKGERKEMRDFFDARQFYLYSVGISQ